MGRGENANAASSLSATYEMTQKFQAILENNILKKKVMEELGCSSFPADIRALQLCRNQFNGAFRDSRFAGNSLSGTAVGAEELHNHFRLYYSQCSIGDSAAAAGFRQSVEPVPTEKYAAMAFLAAALGTAALVGFFPFCGIPSKNETEFGRKIDADLLGTVYHEKKRKNSSMLITNPARSFPYVESLKRIASVCAEDSTGEGGKSAAGDQCGGK